MTIARKDIVNTEYTRYYHTISRCVRQQALCGGENAHRKGWIEDRLELVAEFFSISVSSFSVMDNHLHVNIRLDFEAAIAWTPEEVMRRWMGICPPAKIEIDDPKMVEEWIAEQVEDKEQVEEYRFRLSNLGWFMKSLKEPISRRANREEECTGPFWQPRYKSIAILDELSLLRTCAYIDLNPLAAGVARSPESSKFTSIYQRLLHVSQQGELNRLTAAAKGSVPGSKAAGDIEQDHWLIPIQDRRAHTNAETTSAREGLLPTFSLGNYLLLLDYVSRLYREGKARVDESVPGIFERLGLDPGGFCDQVQDMLTSKSLRGNFMASDPARIREIAAKQGRRHLANLCPQH